MLRAELRGFAFDVDLCTEIVDNLPNELGRIEREIHELAGFRFDVGSSYQTSEVRSRSVISRVYQFQAFQALFVKMRLEAPPNTPMIRGRISVTKAVLEKLSHPIARLIMEYRKLEDCMPVSSFGAEVSVTSVFSICAPFDSQFRAASDESARISTSFPLTPAALSRSIRTCRPYRKRSLSTERPYARCLLPLTVLQPIVILRRVSTSGMLLITGDYSQLELRVLCQLSEDAALFDYLNDKSMDPFERMAVEFGKHTSITVDRGKAKQVRSIATLRPLTPIRPGVLRHDLRNGRRHSQHRALGFQAGCTEPHQRLLRTVSRYHVCLWCHADLNLDVRCWMDKQIHHCRQFGYVETYLGRRREFDLRAKDGFERQALNHIIQASMSELIFLCHI